MLERISCVRPGNGLNKLYQERYDWFAYFYDFMISAIGSYIGGREAFMDSYEQYEQDCERIRKENEKILNDFENWLSDKDLSKKTIANHCNNIDFYINEFLLYEEAIEASDGIYDIGYFLGYWFIRKAMWASKSSIKSNATSIKKFYEFMLEKGKIDEEAYGELKEEIKNNKQTWLDIMDRYDDPDIEDVEEIWGL